MAEHEDLRWEKEEASFSRGRRRFGVPSDTGDSATLPMALLVTPPHPGFGWALLWCLGFLLLTQVLPMLVGGVLLVILLMASGQGVNPAQWGPGGNVMQSWEYAYAIGGAMLLSQVLAVASALLVIHGIVGKDWSRVLAVRYPSGPHLVLTLMGLPCLMVVSMGVEALAKHFLPSFFDVGQMMALFGKLPWALGVLIIGLGPALGEELWFRGFLGRGLVARYGLVGGVLLTSLLFGVMHLEPTQAAATFVMGLFLHWSYLATRSLLVPMILHLANNSLAILALHFSVLHVLNVPGEKIPWYVYGAALLGLATVGWAFFTSRAQLVEDPAAGRIPWEPAYIGPELPPAGRTTKVRQRSPNPLAWLGAIAGFVVFGAASVMGVLQEEKAAQVRAQQEAQTREEKRVEALQDNAPGLKDAAEVPMERWRPFAPSQGRFNILMPGEPFFQSKTILLVGAVKRNAYSVVFSDPQISFWIDYVDLTPNVRKQFSNEEVFQAVQQKMLSQVAEGEIVHEAAWSKEETQAKEWVIIEWKGRGTVVVAQAFAVPQGPTTRIYWLTVRGIGIRPAPTDIAKFFNSFITK
jgi:membrane protease YdiL (CAAX protease family)